MAGYAESTELEPISLSLPVLTELGVKWLMQISEYFAVNPQIIVNGFMKAGITAALDGQEDQQGELHEIQGDSENDFEIIGASEPERVPIFCVVHRTPGASNQLTGRKPHHLVITVILTQLYSTCGSCKDLQHMHEQFMSIL